MPDGLQQIVELDDGQGPGQALSDAGAGGAGAAGVPGRRGDAASPTPEADAKMRSFLTWLEVGDEASASRQRRRAPKAAPSPVRHPGGPGHGGRRRAGRPGRCRTAVKPERRWPARRQKQTVEEAPAARGQAGARSRAGRRSRPATSTWSCCPAAARHEDRHRRQFLPHLTRRDFVVFWPSAPAACSSPSSSAGWSPGSRGTDIAWTVDRCDV